MVPFGHDEVAEEEAGVSRPWEVSGLTEEIRSEDEAVKNLYGKAREVSSVGGDCCWCMLKFVMLLSMLILSFCGSSKGFGYVLGIDATRPRKSRMHGELDTRHGGWES